MPSTYNTHGTTCRDLAGCSHVAGISSNFHPSREKTRHARGASSRLSIYLPPPVSPFSSAALLHRALMHRHGISLAYCCTRAATLGSTCVPPLSRLSLFTVAATSRDIIFILSFSLLWLRVSVRCTTNRLYRDITSSYRDCKWNDYIVLFFLFSRSDNKILHVCFI